MTRQELLDALTAERFSTPTPEWHNSYTSPPELRLEIRRELDADTQKAA